MISAWCESGSAAEKYALDNGIKVERQRKTACFARVIPLIHDLLLNVKIPYTVFRIRDFYIKAKNAFEELRASEVFLKTRLILKIIIKILGKTFRGRFDLLFDDIRLIVIGSGHLEIVPLPRGVLVGYRYPDSAAAIGVLDVADG